MAEQQQTPSDPTPDDAWRFERFLSTIEELAGLDRDRAERAAMATMTTLAERISRARAQELAEDLPERLRFWLQDAKDRPEELDVDTFVRRVAEREEVDAETATRHAEVVFRALARTAPAYEVDDLVKELPGQYERLVAGAARELRESAEPEVTLYVEFVERVKRRADLDLVAAERAAETVLETLAERLPAHEVTDLEAALPEQFGEPLARGALHGRGTPPKMSLDEFVDRAARREHVSFDEAFQHTRAVFATLADALPHKELSDILGVLPRGYRETLF
jgi:uncharacterized protein (DUF2267 family)